jgi:two-component system, NtrC family, nitrogen regulation response regulator NtrX
VKQSILIVDDEPSVCQSLRGILEDEGFQVVTGASGEECLEWMSRRTFDAVLLDIWLPGVDGLETLRRINARWPSCCVVMISGHGTIETAVRATKLGAFDFIEKPLSIDKTLLVLNNALHQKSLEDENRSLREEVERRHVMIGDSIPMQALRQQIDFAAPTDGRILIYGENGTGKELVAHLLHRRSKRSHRRFVEVNCAAIPEDLIESDLFGHMRGSFTGASEDKVGKFAQADGGTLFLDEVGDMSLKTQAKVLRALEEQRFEPVGSHEAVTVDVRVIAATNKNLEAEIEKGNFREDLLFRLNVIPFQVPPLRERMEDLEPLLQHFITEFCRKYGRFSFRFSPAALMGLRRYSWPGNIRELKNMVERLVIMFPQDTIDLYDLPSGIVDSEGGPAAGAAKEHTLQEAREAFERSYILEKIFEHQGNITETARALDIERSHLYRKMRQYRISFPRREP